MKWSKNLSRWWRFKSKLFKHHAILILNTRLFVQLTKATLNQKVIWTRRPFLKIKKKTQFIILRDQILCNCSRNLSSLIHQWESQTTCKSQTIRPTSNHQTKIIRWSIQDSKVIHHRNHPTINNSFQLIWAKLQVMKIIKRSWMHSERSMKRERCMSCQSLQQHLSLRVIGAKMKKINRKLQKWI